MATVNQKLALNAKLHKALHKNVYLLSLYYPMSKDLLSHYKEGMLEKPNSPGFHHLSYYLITIIDPKIVSTTSWAMFEIKIEAKYRSEFKKFVDNLSKDHDGHISHIMASWIVNAGGPKVTKLLFELSQVALKLHLQRRGIKVKLDFKDYEIEDACTRNVEIQERVLHKISWWRTHTINMDRIAEIYLRHIPIMEKEKERQQALLKSLTSSISKCNISTVAKELSDIFTPSKFLESWGEDIDKQTIVLKQKWNEKCIPILERSRKCKARSEQVIQMDLKKSNKDYVLEYNENIDTFNVPTCIENELSIAQSAILRSNVKDGVLHLPNLFKSYAVVITYCFNNYIPNFSAEDLECSLNERRNALMLINQKSKDLVGEVYKFHNELKDGLEMQESSCYASENVSGVLDILNIPSFSAQPVEICNYSEFWQKSLGKYKFTEFKHPFKPERTYFLAEKDASVHNLSRINHSVIKKGFFSSTKESLRARKIEAKPEYLKNIEELEKNMFKIADVANKTYAPQHNMTTISRMGTDRRHSIFSQNHMKYLLTSIKKKSEPDMTNIKENNDKLFRKTWGNLFNESVDSSSYLQKTQSSPNLALNDTNQSKFRSRINKPTSERISGVKEIEYSSFLSDFGSLPNLHNPSDKENAPPLNHQSTVISETISIENRIEIAEIPSDITPKKKVISPSKKKSVESLIDTYKKFKESRGLGGKSNENKNGSVNSKNLADSFLDKLDLGDNKNINKRKIMECS